MYGLVGAVLSLVWRSCLTTVRGAAGLSAADGDPEADRDATGPGRLGTVALRFGACAYAGRAPPCGC
ncbi:hypothetical protein GCM10009853_012150 [Glycomyces scopariae]|uniref:Uncharacterized protein n=1 Tax=Glycomyces sambucus TaxID=380244 RepID=A0A1G9MM88_9ACTN|nr:hypothetical protein [Glycomyces sambucus]SDL75141.1 hypothetical protein SAMN05216298_5053 [Glycomyces sambucus]